MSIFSDNDIEKGADESLREKLLDTINSRDYRYDIFGQEIHKDDYIIHLNGWGKHKILKVICFNSEHEVFCKYDTGHNEVGYIAVMSKHTIVLNDKIIKLIGV